MKNFESFTNYIVYLNGDLPKGMNAGLYGSLPNRVAGDKAEQYIVRKLNTLNYEAYITPGSKSPADIFAVKRRQGYWHIMLIQVKSSKKVSTIKKLNEAKIEELNDLGKFVKAQLKKVEMMNDYSSKPVLVSTGYAAVYSLESKNGLRNLIKNTEFYSAFRSNFTNLDFAKAKEKAKAAHSLKV